MVLRSPPIAADGVLELGPRGQCPQLLVDGVGAQGGGVGPALEGGGHVLTRAPSGLVERGEQLGQLLLVEGVEQVVGALEEVLDLGGGLGVGHHVTVFEEGAVLAVREGHVDELLAEDRLRPDHEAGVLGDLEAGVHVEGDPGLAVDQLDRAHLADVDAPVGHVAAVGQALAGPGEVADQLVVVVVAAVGERDPDPDGGEHDSGRRQAEQAAGAGGELPARSPHPTILAVSWPPQKRSESTKFRVTTEMIETRMARPAAWPTPAGPPEA